MTGKHMVSITSRKNAWQGRHLRYLWVINPELLNPEHMCGVCPSSEECALVCLPGRGLPHDGTGKFGIFSVCCQHVFCNEDFRLSERYSWYFQIGDCFYYGPMRRPTPTESNRYISFFSSRRGQSLSIIESWEWEQGGNYLNS